MIVGVSVKILGFLRVLRHLGETNISQRMDAAGEWLL